MIIERRRKYICLILAFILFFLGMGIDLSDADFFFSCELVFNGSQGIYLQETDNQFSDPAICTLNMIKGEGYLFGNMPNAAIIRYRNKVYFSAFFLTAYLLYQSIYQRTESKEDGQLFLCRSVIVDYIHQKDSGE